MTSSYGVPYGGDSRKVTAAGAKKVQGGWRGGNAATSDRAGAARSARLRGRLSPATRHWALRVHRSTGCGSRSYLCRIGLFRIASSVLLPGSAPKELRTFRPHRRSCRDCPTFYRTTASGLRGFGVEIPASSTACLVNSHLDISGSGVRTVECRRTRSSG